LLFKCIECFELEWYLIGRIYVVLVTVRVTGTTVVLLLQQKTSNVTKRIKTNTIIQTTIPEFDDEVGERCLLTVLTCLRTGLATPTPPPPIRPPLI
jgi:hypothetical protein